MEINKFRHFNAVYETSHLRKASELLNISPSAVSASLSHLEAHFNVKLFHSQGRGIAPSDEAHVLYSDSKRVVEQYDNLLDSQQSPKSEQTLKIATWEVFSTYFMAAMCSGEFKGRKVRVLEKVPGQVEASLLKNETDFGITYAPVPDPKLDFLEITKIEYKAFGKKGAFKNTELQDLPFSVPVTKFPGSPSGIRTLDNWPASIPRKVLYEFELLETALETCRKGLSVIYCPTFIAQLQNKTSIHQFEEIRGRNIKSTLRKVYLVKRKTTPEISDAKKIAKSLRLLCRPMP